MVEKFDALIVYSDRIAVSATNSKFETPFIKGSKNESYNIVYGYFLQTCSKYKVKCAFTTSSDIIGPGKCKSYWTFSAGKWSKETKSCFSKLIFDKFSPVNERISKYRNLLFSKKTIKPFNSPYLYKLFFDKEKTYLKLSKFCIPTVAVKSGARSDIENSIRSLERISSKLSNKDNLPNKFVMKDRFGSGGKSIYKFDSSDFAGMAKIANNISKSFILQPFINFERGFKYKHTFSPTDIRLIYLNGKIIQTYLRIAKSGEFRCNEHRGGKLIYINKKIVPQSIINMSHKITDILGDNMSLFSLDFIIDNNKNIYFLEGNTGPGLDWNMDLKENEIKAKELIRIITKELLHRSNNNKSIYKPFAKIKPLEDLTINIQPNINIEPIYASL
jgi:glutathione synthase/RimK-type ligase-like ATP-grasp enzyme